MTCPACGHTTQGDIIVARASAGAARVEAERALDIVRGTGATWQRAAAIQAAEKRLAAARAAEEAARAAENAGPPARVGHLIVRRREGQVGPSFLPCGLAVSRAGEGGSDYEESTAAADGASGERG